MKYGTFQMTRIEDMPLGDKNKFIAHKEYDRSETINMKIQNRQQANNEYDMLKGNVNRMFLAKDRAELDKMWDFARGRLDSLYIYHKELLEKKEREKE